MKKLIFMFLGLALFLPNASAFAQTNNFSDVSSDYIYHDEVQYLKSNNIVNGYDDGRFGIDDQIKRNEFIKILVNSKFKDVIINTCKARNPGSIFTDVPVDNEFASYICIAKEFEIVSGYSDGTFKPNNYISYPEAAKILIRTFYNYDIHANSILGVYTSKLEELNIVPPTTASYISLTGNTNVELKRGEMADLIYGSKVEKPNEGNKTYFGMIPNNIISMERAISIANVSTNVGSVREIELKHNGALLMYEAEVNDLVIQIDAKTGVVINRFTEGEDEVDYLTVGAITPLEALESGKKHSKISSVDEYEVELEKEESGRYTYSVEIEGEGKDVEMEIDAKTKELLEIIWGEIDETKVSGIISPEEAIEKTQQVNLSILPDMTNAEFEVELKKEDNKYFYVIEVEFEDDSILEINLNATNGKLLGLELGGDEDDLEGDDDENGDEDNDGTGGPVTRAEAEEIALAATSGGVIDEVEVERGVYEIVISVDGQDREVGVDSNTGKVLWNNLDD